MAAESDALVLDTRRMVLRAAVVVPVAAVAASAFLSAFVGIASLMGEGRAGDGAVGRAWFSLVFLGPWIFAGLLVVGAAAAAIAIAVTARLRRTLSNRALRRVWAISYSAVVVLALIALTFGAAWYFPLAIAGVCVILFSVSWAVFAIADRSSAR